MPIVNEKIWASLPFEDFRPQFFIETWHELLSRSTPHFYQARLMNVPSLLKEIQVILLDCLENKKYFSQLKISCMELLHLLKHEEIFKSLFRQHYDLLISLLTEVKNSKDCISDWQIKRIGQAVKFSLNYEDEYILILIGELLDAIVGSTDISKKERILDRISKLTSTLLSVLLSRGFSSTYLYNRVEILTRPSRYGGKKFSEQLGIFFDRLKKRPHRYKVVQAFSSKKKSILELESICGVFIKKEFLEKVAENTSLGWGMGSIDGYFEYYVDSYDYISAALSLQGRIEEIKDIFSYEYKKDVMTVSPVCWVFISENNHTYEHRVKVGLLQNLIVRRTDPYELNMVDAITRISIESKSKSVKDSLRRILRYYRLGLNETTFESKFLSMWIALEAIAEEESLNNIEKIINFVPSIYAHDSLRKRLQYMCFLLNKNGIKVPKPILQKFKYHSEDFKEILAVKLLYQIIKDEDSAKELFNSLEGNEFLKYKIRKIFLEFKTKASITERVIKTRNDVSQQIRRIYYYRNKIVHKAFHGEISPRIYSHLCDYIGCILSEIIAVLTIEDDVDSFVQILQGYALAMESKEKEWEAKKDDLTYGDVIYLTPMV